MAKHIENWANDISKKASLKPSAKKGLIERKEREKNQRMVKIDNKTVIMVDKNVSDEDAIAKFHRAKKEFSNKSRTNKK